MVGNGRNARPTAPTAVLCETECYVVLGTAGLPFSGFVCSALYECSNMASISPSPPRIPFIITEKQKKMWCLFLSTPSAFLSPWQRGSFLIMRKLNLLVPKQRGNKSHARLGPWVSVTRLASGHVKSRPEVDRPILRITVWGWSSCSAAERDSLWLSVPADQLGRGIVSHSPWPGLTGLVSSPALSRLQACGAWGELGES